MENKPEYKDFPNEDEFIKSLKEKIGEYPITYHGNMVTVTSEFGVLMTNADAFHEKMQEAAKKLGYTKDDNNGK